RAGGPFFDLNCGAVPETLFESLLFGCEKGVHNMAKERQEGAVAAAEGGTLFLDEVGDIPLASQVKLLTFLQSKEYRLLGSRQTRKGNVRIIAATNRDLKTAVKDGAFRKDLYYRLEVMPIV